VLRARDFGLPQNRERLYIVGFLDKDIRFNFPSPTFEKGKLQTLFVKKQLLQACHEKCIDDETSLGFFLFLVIFWLTEKTYEKFEDTKMLIRNKQNNQKQNKANQNKYQNKTKQSKTTTTKKKKKKKKRKANKN
jgi:site-specific DNA-cytosine methylase